MSQARGSAALIKRLRCLAKLGLAVSVFVSASGCVETVGIEDVNLDDGGGPGGATGGVIVNGATGGSGPTTSSTGGGSAGIGAVVGVGVGGTAGAGGATGSTGAGGNAGAGGGAAGARPDAGAAGGVRDAGIADARVPDVVVGVTFSMDVRPILQARCSACHAFSTYNVFTTHAVAQCGGDVLAKANDPVNSGFLELVQGQCAGFLMPRGCGTAPCIPQTEINTVTSWIRAGAPNN